MHKPLAFFVESTEHRLGSQPGCYAVYRKRRKDKEVTSSPGGSGSPTGLGSEVDSRPYLDDDFTQERVIDVDLLPLVLPPYGVDYNEWLATHSLYSDILRSAFIHQVILIYTPCSIKSGPLFLSYNFPNVGQF